MAASMAARDVLRTEPARSLDIWHSYWALGYPLWHAYQPIPHIVTGFAENVASSIAPESVFASIKLLLLLAFPLCVFLGARWIGFDPLAAAGAALVSPLASTDGLYGLEYGSYLWRGSGLYTQLWAMDLLPLAVGRSFAAVKGRAGAAGAGVLIALTFLCHTIYGYVAVISFLVAAIVARRVEGTAAVARRALPALAVSALLVAFFLVPMLLDGDVINHSRWESPWKWDSYGHAWVFRSFVTGGLFDHGRLPVLTILVASGLLLGFRRNAPIAVRYAAWGFVAWMVFFFGRPTWGFLLRLAGIPADFHLHRLIGAVHFFGILLAGSALGRAAGRAVETPSRLRRLVPAAVAIALLLPAFVERHRFTREGDRWAEESEGAIAAEREELDAVRERLSSLQAAAPGRVYPGLAATWGKDFSIGRVPLYVALSVWRSDALAFLFHALSLTSDVMVLFDEKRNVEYDVFDVRYVLMDASREPEAFLTPLEEIGRFRILEAPSSGHIGVGRLSFTFRGRRQEVYDVSSAWLKSDLPSEGRLGAIFLREPPIGGAPLVRRGDPFPARDTERPGRIGTVSTVRREGDDWRAEIDAVEGGVVFLKETWHPGWRVEIDGSPVRSFMVTPGFVGAEFPEGRHVVTFRYRPGAAKPILLFAGFAGAGAIAAGLRFRRRIGARTATAHPRSGAAGGEADPVPPTPSDAVREGSAPAPPSARPAVRLRRVIRALLVLAALVGALPLLQGKLFSGHDSLEYPPRIVEFHENVAHGRWAPMWAPDLGNGHGQPLFLFSPPLFYVVSEIFHLAGGGIAMSIILAVFVFYLGSGAGAYAAGREAWGRRGGGLTAAAYLLAPYPLLDLYVRGNFNEYAAVSLYPWAAWAVLRLRGADRYGAWPALALAVAGVGLAHLGALLILLMWIPLAALLTAPRGRRVHGLLHSLGAAAAGVVLAAFFLLPCALQMKDVKADLLRTGFLAYDDHFVAPSQLLWSTWGYGLSVQGTEDGMSFSVGLLHAGLAVLAALFWRGPGRDAHRSSDSARMGGERLHPAVFIVLAVVFVVLTTPLASWFWAVVTPLHYLAYPWRFLSVVSLSLSVASGALASCRPLLGGNLIRRGVPAAALAALVVWGYVRARPKEFLTFDDEYYAPARIAALGMNTTTREEYEPRWVEVRPAYSPVVAEIAGGRAGIVSSDGSAFDRTVDLVVEEAAAVRLNAFYFPGWEASIDGTTAPIEVSPGDGRMILHVGEGRHTIRVLLRDTIPRMAGRAVSALTALLLAGLWIRSRGARGVDRRAPSGA